MTTEVFVSIRVLALFVGAVAYLTTPYAVFAQACHGVPTAEGQAAVTAGAGFTDGAKQFGGLVHGNLSGPLAIRAGYTLTDYDDLDDKGHSFGGDLSFEIPNIGMSACPMAGATYGRLTVRDPYYDDSLELSVLTVPLGIGLGGSVDAGEGITFTPYAMPAFLVQRYSASLALEGVGSASESETELEFGAQIGATLGIQQFLINAGVGLDTADDSDPLFTFRFGVML